MLLVKHAVSPTDPFSDKLFLRHDISTCQSSLCRVHANMAQRVIDWWETKNGKQSPVIDGFLFVSNKTRGDTTYWRCHTSGCNVTTKTIAGIVADVNGEHNHLPDPLALMKKKFKQVLRKTTKENLTTGRREVIILVQWSCLFELIKFHPCAMAMLRFLKLLEQM